MTLQMLLVISITVIVFFGFVRERQPPDVTALLGVSLLLIFGALNADQFLSVFTNGAPITIGTISHNGRACPPLEYSISPASACCWQSVDCCT